MPRFIFFLFRYSNTPPLRGFLPFCFLAVMCCIGMIIDRRRSLSKDLFSRDQKSRFPFEGKTALV